MKTWASLKDAMDSIGSEVQEVLMVRNDLAMLQEDLLQQEAVWHSAEEDLKRQIQVLEQQAQELQAEVTEGSPIGPDVKALQRQVDTEKERTSTSKKLFAHEAMLADLVEKELTTRFGELQERLEEAKSRAKSDTQAARREEADEAESEAALQRELARLRDHAADEAAALSAEEDVARERCDGLRRDIDDVKTTIQHLEAQLIPPAQLEAAVAAMRAQVGYEVRALSEVQIAKEQAAAECDARSTQVTEAWNSEKAKALQRHAEMTEVCDTAEQKQALLEIIVKEACAPLSPTNALEVAPPATTTLQPENTTLEAPSLGATTIV